MDSGMLVFAVILLFIFSLAMVWMHLSLVRGLREMVEAERGTHREERRQWEIERERLLNRCMTRTWESYVQMSAAMVAPGSSTSGFDESQGLSDEEEIRRAGEAQQQGLGEVLLDYGNDFEELGLT